MSKRVAALAVCCAVAVPAATPAPAEAAHARNCGKIYNVVGKRDYRVFATRVRCRTAKRWSRTYLKRRRAPRRYRCYRFKERRGEVRFLCKRGSSRRFYAERV